MIEKLLLYDNFNARYFSYKDVADSFVVNDEFKSLASSDKSVLLMGPRGCGKTTLLKILTPAGLNYWSDSYGTEIKKKIQYISFYIPSDIQWKNQFDYLEKYLSFDKDLIQIIVQFLFASNVQIALTKTFKSVVDFDDKTLKDKLNYEYEICKGLITDWDLSKETLPTFDNIELSILTRIKVLNNLVSKSIFQQTSAEIRQKVEDYVFTDFFDLIKIGCKIFENFYFNGKSHKWALCFDELEIVPKFLQLKLISFLRSVDQKFIFKLTTTPLFQVDDYNLDVTQGNDFSPIKLWVYNENGLNKWEKFCSELILKRLHKKYGQFINELSEIFGESNLDKIIKNELSDLKNDEKESLGFKGKFVQNDWNNNSSFFMFKRLAEIDSSFKEFLEKRGIDSSNPITKDPITKKAVFLKYKVDVLYRLIYKGRTRRNAPIHGGIPHLFDICDGNPRLIIGLIDEILKSSNFSPENCEEISLSLQSSITIDASEKYFNLLKNHPDSTIIINNSEFNLASDLIARIGLYMRDNLLGEEFNKSAPTTFIVDEDINAKMIGLLEIALYLGAIVYLDPVESLSKTGILNKRFRLSGFLTPKFKIPSRINSQVKLSTILKKTTLDTNQQEIF